MCGRGFVDNEARDFGGQHLVKLKILAVKNMYHLT